MNWKRWNYGFTWSLGSFCPFSAMCLQVIIQRASAQTFPIHSQDSCSWFSTMLHMNVWSNISNSTAGLGGMGRKGNICFAQLWSWRQGNLCLFEFFSHAVRKTCKWSVKEKLFWKQTGTASLKEQGHQENPKSRAQLREIPESWD